jgi:hypothetical protein
LMPARIEHFSMWVRQSCLLTLVEQVPA